MAQLATLQAELTASTSTFERKMKSAGDTVEETGDQMAEITDDEEDLRAETRRLARSFARNFGSMASDVDDAKDEVDQLDRALDDIDGRDAHADVHVDRDRAATVGRGVGEAVGMAGVVEEDMGRDIGEGVGRLSAALGGTTGATIAAGAAFTTVAAAALTAAGGLAGAGGLAVKALQLANELDGAASPAVASGLDDLKNASENLKRQFVKEMSPLLVDIVIPALKSMAQEVSKVIPDLAAFAATWVPSLIDMLRGWIKHIPLIIGAVDGLMRVFAALYDGTATAAYFLGYVLIETIDGIVRVFQELAKGVISALQFLESFFPESAGTPDWEGMKETVENMDSGLEGASESAREVGQASAEEFIENATGSTDTGERDFGVNEDSDLYNEPNVQLPDAPAASASQVEGAGLSRSGGTMSGANARMQQTSQRLEQMKQKLMPLRTMLKSLGNTVKAFGKKAAVAFSQQMGGAIADAIVEGENLLDSFTNIIKSLIKKLIALIAKATIAAAVMSLVTNGTSFGGAFTGIIGTDGGGIGQIPDFGSAGSASAAGAVTQTSGVATSSSTQSMNINVTGTTRTEGRDIVTSFETTKQDNRRKGRIDRS